MISKKLDETKNIVAQLEEIGLSNKEARVYVALLPHKDAGSSLIISITKLHGQFVYNALEHLEEVGLVYHVIKNGRKKFTANSPKRILALLDEKRLSAQSVIRQLESRFAGSHEQDFTIYQGETAFITHQMELLRNAPEGSTVYVIASDSDGYMPLLEVYGMDIEFESLRKRKKIRVQYLGAVSQVKRLAQMAKDRAFWEYRTLPGQSLGKMSIEIWPQSVNFNVYGEPILDFHLMSQDVRDGYESFFETLWRLGT